MVAVYVAKAYCNGCDEAVGLRRKLVTFKCLCLDVCSSCFAYVELAGTVLEEEPALLGEMSELIDPENAEQVPYEASLAALRAFVRMSVFKPGCSDLLRAWGGNMARSEMFSILETILEGAKRDLVVMQQPYMNYVFNMVANFMDHRRFAGYLRSAGLMNILLALVAQRTNYRLTRSGPIHLIEMFIDGCPEVLDDFIAQDGFRIVIDALQYEVDFALQHPEYGGGPPAGAGVTFCITVRQVKTMGFLLKLVCNLITRHPGDRMRNLYDSEILQSLIRIMQHPAVFGASLLADTLRIVSGILNSEPTAYAILEEGGVVDAFFEGLDAFLMPDGALLAEIPDVIGAIALSRRGNARVLRERVVERTIGVLKDAVLYTQLLREEHFVALGRGLDELARHYPNLQPAVWASVADVLATVPGRAEFQPTQLYQSPNGCFYRSPGEQAVQDELGGTELPTWRARGQASVLECSAAVCSMLFDGSGSWDAHLDVAGTVSAVVGFVTVENAPFDYVVSNAVYAVAGIMKAVSERHRAAFLHRLCEELLRVLEGLRDFVYCTDSTSSFFDRFEGRDPELGGRYLSRLCTANCLLYLLSDVYVSPNRMQSKCSRDLAREFDSGPGRQLLDLMLHFYRRVALEEAIFHWRTPAKAAENAAWVHQGISRYHAEIGRPAARGRRRGTSAKSKNLTVLFFHFSRCQAWLRYIFAGLCRLAGDDPCTGDDFGRAVGILLRYAETATRLLGQLWDEDSNSNHNQSFIPSLNESPNHELSSQSLNQSIPQSSDQSIPQSSDQYIHQSTSTNHLSTSTNHQSTSTSTIPISSAYSLLAFNHIFSSVAMRPSASASVNSVLVIALLQFGCFKRLRELAGDAFRRLATFPAAQITKYADAKYVDIHPCSTTIVFLNQVLSFYALATSRDSVQYVPKARLLYPGLQREHVAFAKEVGSSLLVQTSIAGFALLEEVLGKDHCDILAKPRGIPSQLIEKLAVISENFYVSANSTTPNLAFEGRLYCLSAQPETVQRTLTATPHQFLHLCTMDDLNFIRGAHQSRLLGQWYRMAELFPAVSPTVSTLLGHVCSHSSYFFYPDVVGALVPRIIACIGGGGEGDGGEGDGGDGDEDGDRGVEDGVDGVDSSINSPNTPSNASSLLRVLLSLIDDDANICSHQNMHMMIAKLLVDVIKPANINSAWMPDLLAVLLRYLTHSRVPKVPNTDPISVSCDLPDYKISFPAIWVVDPLCESILFDTLLNVTEVRSASLAAEICKVMLVLCDSYAKVRRVFASSLVPAILGYFRLAPLEMDPIQGFVMCLLRYGFEDRAVVRAYMQNEVDKDFSFSRGHFRPAPVRDLPGLVKQQGVLVLRDPDAYIDTLSSKVILYQFEEPLCFLDVSVRTKGDDAIIEEEKAEVNDNAKGDKAEVNDNVKGEDKAEVNDNAEAN